MSVDIHVGGDEYCRYKNKRTRYNRGFAWQMKKIKGKISQIIGLCKQ